MTTQTREIIKTTFKLDSTIKPEVARIVFDLLEGKINPKDIRQAQAFNGMEPKPAGSKASDRLLKGVEAAKIIGVHPYTLRDWARNGLIRSVRLPGSAKTLGYRLSDIEDFIERNTVIDGDREREEVA